MFGIIVTRVLEKPQVIGPFPHEEDAEVYAEKHKHDWHLWRIVPLTAP
jgi:hypothetical protein